MITAWHDYLSPKEAFDGYRDCHERCRAAFDRQRECIERIFEARRPRTVACLGAGVLNDIPYWRFAQANVTLHLVDWLPGVSEFGVANAIVRRDTENLPQCVYCDLADADPAIYCRNYRRRTPQRMGVCDAFVPAPDRPDLCGAFVKGRLPHIHQQDVTGGYASAFGAGLADALKGVTSWRQALRRATALARRVAVTRRVLEIPDHSIDLVVSSMVISQFEHEPFAYFSRQVAAMVGPPTAQEVERLRPANEALRDILLTNQVRGHADEIERILAPGGRCFVAFELFHRAAEQTHWQMVHDTHAALRALSERFAFDFEEALDPIADAGFEVAGGRSVVYHFLLTPPLH